MPSRKWIWITAALLLGILAAACAPNPQPPGLTAIPSLAPGATVTLLPAIQGGPAVAATPGAGDAAAGAAVFLKNCSPCHGNQAQGGIGPALRNNPVITSGDQAVFSTIANGIVGSKMPAWIMSNGGPLTSTDISNVIAYLKTLQNVQPLPSPTEAPAEPTETPLPANAPTPEPARPSNAGGPGKAVTLTGDPASGRVYFGQFCAACHGPEGVQGVPNPGSEDGSVPPLNPIDPTIANPDLKVFAQNVDLFIEHGSVPDGEDPQIVMPSFGDSKLLTDQQIADIIAFIIQLNTGK